MAEDTPRGIIRGLLQASEDVKNGELPKSGSSKMEQGLQGEGRLQSPRFSTSGSSRGSSPKLKYSSSKRPAQESPKRASKRKKSIPTPSETITPRTTIKAFLQAADTESPVESSSRPAQEAKVEHLTRLRKQESLKQPPLAISGAQFQRLVGSSSNKSFGASSRRSSRESGRKQTFATPSDNITPRAIIKTFLQEAEIETPTEGRSTAQNQEGEVPVQEQSRESLVDGPPVLDIVQDKPEISVAGTYDNSAGDSLEPTHEPGAGELEQYKAIDEIPGVSDISDRYNSTSLSWGKLQTPVLPEETVVKASPALAGKPPIPPQTQKLRKTTHRQEKRSKTGAMNKNGALKARFPLSLIKGIFDHFSATNVFKDAYDVIQTGSDAFFKQLSLDLASYSKHAKRKTIEQADVELLMRRQGLVHSRESFHALIEKYLPMEYRQDIIPSARAGNVVVPKMKY